MLTNLTGDEDRRSRALLALRTPDESRDDVLQKFVRLASQALGIPGSFISVLDDEKQYVRAARNFKLKESARSDSLCRYVVDSDTVMVVPDTHRDDRFSKHPLIIGAPYIRFYAGTPLKNSEGEILGTLCVTDAVPHTFSGEQVTTLKLLAALVMSFLQAWHASSFADPVTSQPNRQRLIRDLQFLGTAGDKTLRRLILIDCIDLSHAYELARSMGMGPVESLLKDVATLLPLRLRPDPTDTIYTVATGRFAILTRADSKLSAAWVTDKLQGIHADIGDGLTVALTPRAGEVDFCADVLPSQEVLRRSVSALHEAIGQNVLWQQFSEIPDARRTRDFTLMNDLLLSLRNNTGLYLVYQPKICLKSGLPVGLEALIRWQHPTLGELSPAAFIPLAEQTELLCVLTDWVADQVILRLSRLRDNSIQLPVTFNVSGQDLARPEFALALNDKITRAGLPAALLGVECLETEEIIESPDALKTLEALKSKGFIISLDDFGSGYSNINYLRRMPIDVIKLDRALISELSSDTASRIIARSIISMLKELNYVVLAEGVENAETASTLTQYGCDHAQGFFYSRPLAESELDNWLAWKLRDQC
ncbi:EAL domain-containing protein [Pantoea sp. GD03673]|uniref:EAL domain-containing protein n=1 Tax=Pantoea sp. GD03673 TaxID=2975364 RepID=UPI0024493E60|nr:EAL domain-containing protein [Pantoea sp. GD03673]MDH2067215.1 EAL domain-containing protein [Pantoea sp. GD03673]